MSKLMFIKIFLSGWWIEEKARLWWLRKPVDDSVTQLISENAKIF